MKTTKVDDLPFHLQPSVGTWLFVRKLGLETPAAAAFVEEAVVLAVPRQKSVEELETENAVAEVQRELAAPQEALRAGEKQAVVAAELSPMSIESGIPDVTKTAEQQATSSGVAVHAKTLEQAAAGVRLAAAKGLQAGLEMASKAEIGVASSLDARATRASPTEATHSTAAVKPLPVVPSVPPVVAPKNEKALPKKTVSCELTAPSTPTAVLGQSQDRTPSTATPSPASKIDTTPASVGASPAKATANHPSAPAKLGKEQQAKIDSTVGSMLDRFFGDDRVWKKVDEEITISKRAPGIPRSQANAQFKVEVPKPYPGVQYRKSKRLDDKDKRFAENGVTVSGTLEDDGEWLRVGTEMFLPMRVGMVEILHPLPGQPVKTIAEPEVENAPRPWWACCSASDVASSQAEVVVDPDGKQSRRQQR